MEKLWNNSDFPHITDFHISQQCARCGPSSTHKEHSPQFSAHICCGQTAGWVKMPLGRKVGLGPGHIVLHGYPAPPEGAQHPIFGPCVLWPNGRPSQLLLSTCLVSTFYQVDFYTLLCTCNEVTFSYIRLRYYSTRKHVVNKVGMCAL